MGLGFNESPPGLKQVPESRRMGRETPGNGKKTHRPTPVRPLVIFHRLSNLIAMTAMPTNQTRKSSSPQVSRSPTRLRRIAGLLAAGIGLAAILSIPQAALAQSAQTATDPEMSWQSLFDGHSPRGWRAWQGADFPKRGWVITNQCLVRWPGGRAGDLVTVAEFVDFEFEWEWKIVPGGNNGVKYLVLESRPSAPGHEYQMVDDRTVTDPRHRTAAFYDVLAPEAGVLSRPPGQWNLSRIIVRGHTVEHWLNGQLALRYELGSPALREAIRASKFRNSPGFGEKCRGRIMLTDHGTETWFRNLRIRVLNDH